MVAESPRADDGRTTRSTVAAGFALGAVLFGYGLGASLGVVPGRGFVIGAFVYAAMAIGAVLVSLMGFVAVQLLHTAGADGIPEERIAAVSVTAPLVAAGGMALTRAWSGGLTASALETLTWTLLGQTVLSVQLFVGSLQPARRRRTVLAAETVVVSGAIAAFLAVTHDPPSPGSLLFLSGGGAVAFLLFGGLFFRLGRAVASPTP